MTSTRAELLLLLAHEAKQQGRKKRARKYRHQAREEQRRACLYT